ncbi:unnamed protein product [Arctogadus glacialis]
MGFRLISRDAGRLRALNPTCSGAELIHRTRGRFYVPLRHSGRDSLPAQRTLCPSGPFLPPLSLNWIFSCFPAVTTGARLSKNQQTPLTDELETPGSRRPLLSSEAPEGNPLNGRLRVRELADTSRPEQKSCKYTGFSCLTLHPSPSVSTSQPQP